MPSKKGSSKKSKKSDSLNVFDMFTQKQVAEFKEGFQVMDHDRDGVITKNDLRATYDELGRIITDKELDEMMADAPGPLNFTTFVAMFGARNQGGESDDDDVVAQAFRAFEKGPGEIDSEQFRSMLMAFGDRFTPKEVDEAFEQMDMDEDTGIIDSDALVAMLTAGGKEEEAAAE